jgi:hypothetical protein
MLITDGVGSFGYTAEFNDKEACENALKVIQETRLASLDAHYNGWLVANCFPKD